ncbi:MAG: IS66 family transposase [Bacteroidaceae bacterium]|nr:IS66 family transposase [Bacteroidaceae bacterium]
MTEKDILMKTIETLNSTVSSLSATNNSLQKRIDELTAQVAWLNRQLFGRKSEKLAAYDPNQLDLFSGQLPENATGIMEARDKAVDSLPETTAERKRERKNRKMMEDLPVLEKVVIEPEGIDMNLYKKIGEEVTRVVEHKPGQLYIKEIIRPKYGLRDNTSLPPSGMRSVEIAPLPLLPIYKGIAGPTLLAEILLQKYEYHLPFYRQVQQFRHLGFKASESTIDGWFKPTVELLKPLYEVLKSEIMKSDYLQGDETTVPVMDKSTHKMNKEYLWLVRAVEQRLVLFHYNNGSRSGTVIEKLTEGFNGYFQCDGFDGYESAFKTRKDVHIVNCMAHIRRHFEQAIKENKEMAEHALKEIQLLYRIEHDCDERELTAGQRKQERQEKSKPIMQALKLWMETEGIKYSPSSLIGKAITYAYTRWDNMMRYLEDGRIRIDNNLAENAIRPVTLGRKNYLFCGNHEAAVSMSVVCSLLATCKAHEVNPREYLNDVIAKMPYMQKASYNELLQLLPHKWKTDK